MIEPTSIVIDKDFLQGGKLEELREIIGQGHRLLVTAELVYEIFTTDHRPFFKKCFEDLLAFREHIDIIDHLGTLINAEIEKHVPCTPISSYFLPQQLNPNFNFIFDKGMDNHLKEFERDLEKSSVIQFEKVVLEIKNNFPKLKKDNISNPEETRKIYGRLTKSNDLPLAEVITEQWAIFRTLQVDCLAAIEYLQSLKDGQFNISEKRKGHNQIDFRICVFALLTKGLASKDDLIRRYFKFLCPDGILFPNEQKSQVFQNLT